MTSKSPVSGPASILAANVKRARTDLGLTQSQLARQIGASANQSVSNWERGVHSPSLTRLVALSELRGVEIAWFYTAHDEVAA